MNCHSSSSDQVGFFIYLLCLKLSKIIRIDLSEVKHTGQLT